MAISHSRRGARPLMSEINVVPYIDVMLVLLVIFMITAPLLTEGVKVDLPQAAAKQVDTQQDEPFVVLVSEAGEYFLNEDTDASDEQRILAAATAVLRHNPNIPFLVKGDRNVVYEHVVRAMVLLQQAGVPSVGLVTETPAG